MATVDESFLVDVAHISDLVASPTGDLDRQTGIANYTNALFHRLITEPGSLVHRPDYGVGIKKYQNVLNRLPTQRKIANDIDEQFSQDVRTEKVLGVLIDYNDLEPSETTIRVRIQAKGIGELTLPFLPFSEA